MKHVYLITGSPGAGKSTYAKKHAGPNDIVFDLDEVVKSLGGDYHEEEDTYLTVALAMRDAAISEIGKRHGHWENAYFITASSDRQEIDHLAMDLDAEEVSIDTPYDKCIENILHDDTRTNKEGQIALVKKWHGKDKEDMNVNVEEYKKDLSRVSGIPVNMLTRDTPEEILAQAKAITLFAMEKQKEDNKTPRERFAEWMGEKFEAREKNTASLFGVSLQPEQEPITPAGYPQIKDGGEVANMPDGRSVKEQFKEWFEG